MKVYVAHEDTYDQPWDCEETLIKITEHKISFQTSRLLVELYKNGIRGAAFDTWIDNGYFLFHICIYRHNFKVQWWKGKK